MKAVLCMDNNVFEIENWFNFEDSKKFVLESLPKHCTLVVDDKLFTSMKKLGLTQNFNMVVFGSTKNFEDAITCEDFSILAKELAKTKRVFVLNGSSVFDELLPFCSTLTVAKFKRKLPKGNIASEPTNSDRWFRTTTTNKKIAQVLNYVNVMPFPLFVMGVKKQLEDERKKAKTQKRDSTVAAKTFALNKDKDDQEDNKQLATSLMNRVTSHPKKVPLKKREIKTQTGKDVDPKGNKATKHNAKVKINNTKIPANSEDIMKRVVRKKTSSIKTENKNTSKKPALEEFAKTE